MTLLCYTSISIRKPPHYSRNLFTIFDFFSSFAVSITGIYLTHLGFWSVRGVTENAAVGWGDCNLTPSVYAFRLKTSASSTSRSAETPLRLGPSRPASRRPSSGKVTRLLSVSRMLFNCKCSHLRGVSFFFFFLFEMFVLIHRCYQCEPTN